MNVSPSEVVVAVVAYLAELRFRYGFCAHNRWLYDPVYYQSQPPQPGGYYDPVYYQSQPPQPGGYYDPVYYQSQPLQPGGYSDTLNDRVKQKGMKSADFDVKKDSKGRYQPSCLPLSCFRKSSSRKRSDESSVRSRRKRYYSPSSDESFEDSRSKEKESFSDSGAEVVQPWVGSIRLGVSGEEEDSACGPLIDGVAMRALYPPRPTNKNILKNGGFEEGPLVLPGSTTRVLIPPFIEDDHSPLPGWMVESLKAVKYVDTEHFSIPQGRRAIELVVGKESDIAQVARTIIGKTYVLSFAVGDANNACKGSMVVEAFAGRDTLKVPYESRGTGGFKRASIRFVAVSTRTRVMFYSTFYAMRSDDFSSLCGPVIDDVKLLSVRKR
ncbi:hypothetical protein DY000_02026038 [Brassica cretica]|uniref:DUF642 domain-containing protein n=1 Tax=Brassica cretica TaxID=69181 RepID=A0ABQ7E991_BRACR|nr:hypothetical protein DY000_02026038 [Brassica cretica]